MKFVFSKTAEAWLKKSDPQVSRRIARKLLEYLNADDPLQFAKSLTMGKLPRYYRFRIGEYRVIFTIKDEEMVIVKIGHRREVYQRGK